MNGGKVVIRAFGDKPVVAQMLAREGEVAVVCRPELASDIRAGRHPMPMIAFRDHDIYPYDVTLLERARKGERIDWAVRK